MVVAAPWRELGQPDNFWTFPVFFTIPKISRFYILHQHNLPILIGSSVLVNIDNNRLPIVSTSCQSLEKPDDGTPDCRNERAHVSVSLMEHVSEKFDEINSLL